MLVQYSIPSWLVWAVIKCTVHFALSKQLITQLKPVQQSRKQVLRTYCLNIYILWVQYFFSPCHTSKLCDMSAQWVIFIYLNFFPIKKDFCMCESIFFPVNLIANKSISIASAWTKKHKTYTLKHKQTNKQQTWRYKTQTYKHEDTKHKHTNMKIKNKNTNTPYTNKNKQKNWKCTFKS